MLKGKYGSLSFTLLFPIVVELASGLTVTPESVIVKTGESVVVTCSDYNDTDVMWTSRKTKLSETTEPRVEMSKYGIAIYFNKVTEADGGNYTCKAGKEKRTFMLRVHDPLVFVDTPPVQEGKEGTDVTLRCEVKGKSMISWYLGGEELKLPKYDIMGDGLLIHNVTKEDAKTYICRATRSDTGDVKKKEIKLRVLHKPYPLPHRVLAEVEPAWGYIESRVNLSCDAIAEPPPKFEWLGNRNVKYYGKIYNDTYKSVLELYIRNSSLFGNYKCKVTNIYGTLERIFALQKGERPHLPDFVELRGANSDLLDLGIHPPKESASGMEPIGYEVQYRIKGNDAKKGNWTTVIFNISQADSYLLRNLQHSTTYEIRVATKNVAGVSPFTNSSFFTTYPLEPDRASTHFTLLHYCLIMMLVAITCW